MSGSGRSSLSSNRIGLDLDDHDAGAGQDIQFHGKGLPGSPNELNYKLSFHGSMIPNMNINNMKSRSERVKILRKHFVKNQPPLLVLEFSADGVHFFRELRREEILEEARRAIPHPNINFQLNLNPASVPANTADNVNNVGNGNVNGHRVDSQNSIRFLNKRDRRRSFADLSKKHMAGTLRARDIRLLDNSFSNSHDPSIVVRRHAVLVNLPPIKSLILFDRCFVLVPNGADAILTPFMDRLRTSTNNENGDNAVHDTNVNDEQNDEETYENESFDMRALEAIFITVSSLLHKELEELKPIIKSTLKKIFKTKDYSLEKLRQVKGSLSQLESKIRGVQHAFMEVLENDSDMALMNLTKVRNNPDLYTQEEEDEWHQDHEEIELLLENYLQSVDGTYNQALLLDDEIESAMSLLMLRLDTARNSLLKVDLMVSVVTAVAAVGALVTGIFGMNLASGINESPNGLWYVAGSLAVVCIICVVSIIGYLKTRGWMMV